MSLSQLSKSLLSAFFLLLLGASLGTYLNYRWAPQVILEETMTNDITQETAQISHLLKQNNLVTSKILQGELNIVEKKKQKVLSTSYRTEGAFAEERKELITVLKELHLTLLLTQEVLVLGLIELGRIMAPLQKNLTLLLYAVIGSMGVISLSLFIYAVKS